MQNVMHDDGVQSYFHDAIISIHEPSKNKWHQFRLFCKNHKELAWNGVVERLCGEEDIGWKGDIVVAKIGAKDRMVNIRNTDRQMANYAVKW
jgi:hypothetical protein